MEEEDQWKAQCKKEKEDWNIYCKQEDLEAWGKKEDCKAWRKEKDKLCILTKRSKDGPLQILKGLKFISSDSLLFDITYVLDKQDYKHKDLEATCRLKEDDREDRQEEEDHEARQKEKEDREASWSKEFVPFDGTKEQEIVVLKLLLPSDGAHPFKDTLYPLDVNFRPQIYRSFLQSLYNNTMNNTEVYIAIQDLLQVTINMRHINTCLNTSTIGWFLYSLKLTNILRRHQRLEPEPWTYCFYQHQWTNRKIV